jgi:hypothetical protein
MHNEDVNCPCRHPLLQPSRYEQHSMERIVGVPAFRGWLNGVFNATVATCLDWYESHEACPLDPSDNSPSQLGYNSGGMQWQQLSGFVPVFGFFHSSFHFLSCHSTLLLVTILVTPLSCPGKEESQVWADLLQLCSPTTG